MVPINGVLQVLYVKNNVGTNHKIVSNFGSKDKKFIPICHFYGFKGHIRPRCFNMMSFVKKSLNDSFLKKNT